MSNKQLAIDLISSPPEDRPLKEIARKIALLTRIQAAELQAAREKGIPAADARQLIDPWFGK